MRVARVIARLNVGGPARHVLLLTAHLDPARYASLLVSGVEAPGEGDMLDMARALGVAPLRLPRLGREISPPRDAGTLLRLVRLFRTLRPHVVHTHTAKAGVVGRLAARLARVPVVVHTYHGHVFDGYFSPAKTRLFLAIERALARVTDRLLTVSDHVRDDLLRLGVGTPDRLTVLPLGLELAPFLDADRRRGELRAELGLAADAPLVAIVARLVPIKRHEHFFAAFRRLLDGMPAAHALIVGDGERRTALEAEARRLGVDARVRFLGWRTDLDRVYADADVVALTSANEGSPVALIEAMAAARPVVATRVGGVPDLVEHGVSGLLVEPGDVAGFAEALAGLLADAGARRRAGEAGRKRVYPAYGAERLVEDMDRLYQDLLRGKAR